jgi:hypothetical protein
MPRERSPRAKRQPTTPTADALTPSAVERIRSEARAELILAQLELRFGKVPPHTARRVRRGNPDDLRRWATRMLLLPTLRDVVALPKDPEDEAAASSFLFAAVERMPKELREKLAPIVDTIRERGTIPGDWMRGEAFGRATGQLEGASDLVLHLLSCRFRRVPKRVEQRVEDCIALGDEASLYRWAEGLLTAATLSEVFTPEDLQPTFWKLTPSPAPGRRRRAR